jgi:hypothetical protein
MNTVRFRGRVCERSTWSGVPSVLVEAVDAGGALPAPVAAAFTDADGAFELSVSGSQVRRLFESRNPMVFFRVLRGLDQLASTDATLRWVLLHDGAGRIVVEPPRPLERLDDYLVCGRVTHAESGPLAGYLVRVFARAIAGSSVSETELTRTTLRSDGRGRFGFGYRPSAGATADLVVRAYDADARVVAEVEACAAPPLLEVDLVVGGTTYPGPSEYARVRERVEAALRGRPVRDMTEAQVGFVACSQQLRAQHVEALRAAVQLEAETTGLTAQVYYGWIRQGLPAARAALFATPIDELERYLLQAVERGHVSSAIERTLAEVLPRVTDEAVRAAFLPRDGARGLGEIVAVTPGASVAQQEAFVRRALLHRGEAVDLWAAVEADPVIAATPGLAQRLRFGVDAGAVTFNHPTLLAHLHALHPATLTGASALARYTEAEWMAMLDAQGVVPPPETPGDTLAEKRAAFAGMVARTVEGRYRTRVHAERILAAQPTSDLATFFRDNQAFDFEAHRVSGWLAGNGGALGSVPEAQRAAVVDQLQTLERIVKVTRNHAEASAVLAAGYTSARRIYEREQSAFLGEMEPFMAIEAAVMIHQRAAWTAYASVALLAKYHASGDLGMQVFSSYQASPAPSLPPSMADWETLFGTLNTCRCKHCASIYSPSAYLVDLLAFAKRNVLHTKLFARRPELPLIELSCATALTPLPTIDLINEILEVALWRLTSGASPAWPAVTTRTTATEDELRAAPEVLYPVQFEAAYQHLAAAVFPFDLPFYLFVDEARIYLEHLGVPRHRLVEVLQGPAGLPQPAPLGWDDWIAAERLGMSLATRAIVVGPSPGQAFWGLGASWLFLLAKVPTFLERSGLSFDALRELLATRYATGIELTSALGCDVNDFELAGIDGVAMERMHRFLRLRGILGWTSLELDEAVAALGTAGAIDAAILAHLGGVRMLERAVSTPRRRMLAWWAQLDTHGLDPEHPANEWRRPVYAEIFLDRRLVNPSEPVFAQILDNPAPPPLGDHRASVRAALEVSEADLALLLDADAAAGILALPPVLDAALPTTTLTLANLSRLHAVISFARAVRLSVADLRVLVALAGANPVQGDAAAPATPATTLAFLEVSKRVRAARTSIAELHYLFRHVTTPGALRAPTDETVGSWLLETTAIVARAYQSARVAQDPDGARAESLLVQVRPGLSADEIAEIQRIVSGTSTEPTLAAQWAFIEARVGFVFEDPAEAQAVLAWQPFGAEPPTPPDRSVPDRRAYLAERLERFAASVEELSSWVASTFEIEPAAAAYLLRAHVLDATTTPGEPAVRDFVARFVPGVPAADAASLGAHLRRIDKAARIVRSLSLTDREVMLFIPTIGSPPPGAIPWIDLAALPVTLPAAPWDLSAAQVQFDAWLRMADLAGLRRRVFGGMDTLVDLFAVAGADGATLPSVLDWIAAVTGWSPVDLPVLAARFGVASAEELLGAPVYLRLEAAIAALTALGVGAGAGIGWTDLAATGDAARTSALDARKAAREKHGATGWAEVARPLRNKLRERQRDALVAAYLQADGEIRTTDELFEKLLLDTQMTACDRTSRIVLAHAAVQLYVDRVLLGIEPAATLLPDARQEWDRLSRYRVWEASRRILHEAESYLVPELRDDKSPLYNELETQILQAELTQESAEEAIRSYVRGLLDIANLEVVAMVEEKPAKYSNNIFGPEEPIGLGLGWTANGRKPANATSEETIHVFARSGAPYVYYHRRRVGNIWKPWEKLDIEIEGAHLVPVVYHHQLFLFWAVAQLKSEPVGQQPMPLEDQPLTEPKQFWDIKLSWSTLRNGRWSRKRAAAETLSLRPGLTTTPIVLTDPGQEPPDESAQFLAQLTFYGRSTGSRIELEAVYERDDKAAVIGRLRYDPCTESVKAIRGQDDDVHWMDLGNMPADAQPELIDLAQHTPYRRLWQSFGERGPALRMFVPPMVGFKKVLGSGPAPLLPGDSRYAIVQDRSQYDLQQVNLVVQDAKRAFFARRLRKSEGGPVAQLEYVEPTTPSDIMLARSYRFELLSHPFACNFVRQVETKGVQGLLRWSLQKDPLQLEKEGLDSIYQPVDQWLAGPFPKETVDFDPTGSMSIYNWELFFHAPFAIAMAFLRDGKHREAREWLHCLFDPTDRSDEPAPRRFWKVKPFYENANLADVQSAASGPGPAETQVVAMLKAIIEQQKAAAAAEAAAALISGWQKDPFNPYAVARLRIDAFQKATFTRYLDVLIAWGDDLFAQDTRETINEAAQLYILASRLLGERPTFVERQDELAPMNFAQLEPLLDASSNATIQVESMALSAPSSGWSADTSVAPAPTTYKHTYFCIPPNEKLLSYWDVVADRLWKIRHCQNIEGVERELALFSPPIDPALLVRASAMGVDISTVLQDLNAANPRHRFAVLHARAVEMARSVVSLAGELLSAREKGDAEAMNRLRQTHEVALLSNLRESRRRQVTEAQNNLVALQRTRATVDARRVYYATLQPRIPQETRYTEMTRRALQMAMRAQDANRAAQQSAFLPDFSTGSAGSFGSPVMTSTFGGQTAARVAGLVSSEYAAQSSHASMTAGSAITEAGWLRRNTEWKHLAAQAQAELRSIDSQIAAAEIRVELAERELAHHELQLEQSRQVEDYLHDKFTNKELYEWMVGQVSALHYQSFKLAYDMAKKAERAYALERGEAKSPGIVQFGHWEGSKRGLLAGQRLLLDLARLEAAYIDGARREYEITKNISLAETDPMAFLALVGSGQCTFAIGEAHVDQDFPGHWLRRLKTVAVTVAHVAPASDSVQLKLTLTSSQVRRAPLSSAPGAALEVDAGRIESFVTSTGVQDAGLFEPNLQGDQLLPFEGAGIVSTWAVHLPLKTNRLDRRSLTDVTLHVRYTARDGGDASRDMRLQELLADDALTRNRLVHVRRDFVDAFQAFIAAAPPAHVLSLPLPRSTFVPVLDRAGIEVATTTIVVRAEEMLQATWTVTLPGYAPEPLAFAPAPNLGEGFHLAVIDTAWVPDDISESARLELGVMAVDPIDAQTFGEIWVALAYRGT